MILTRYSALLSLTLALMAPQAGAVTNPVGGGLLEGGLYGQYYEDETFSNGSFTRRDIRIDFDWGELRKPGGSLHWTRLGQLGSDSYSVRWEGKLMARFSETYELTAYADSVRIWVKPIATAEYPTEPLIDYWPGNDPVEYLPQSAEYDLIAGEAYDIRIEYRERTGPARMQLLWSSPSTPQEVIQPTANIGNIPPQRGVILVDAVMAASNWGENYPWGVEPELKNGSLDLDADGWPREDFNFILRPSDLRLHLGTYLVEYEGSSTLSINVGGGEILSADGSESYGTSKTETEGYNPATNTTSVRFRITNDDRDAFWPVFQYTDRDGPEGTAYGHHSGITNLRILRPSGINSDTPHEPDELFAREAIETLETFVTYRWNDVNGSDDANPNGETEGRWEHRRPWGPNAAGTRYTSENHEYKILLSNHSGRDLYIQVPHASDDDYIRKMAQLILFGANEEGLPYTTEVADPYFPPLNPNLRVNVEYSNEIPWNTAGQYPQGHWARLRPEDFRQAWLDDPDSPDGQRWQILNFDGHLPNNANAAGFDAGKRFTAFRTVEMSKIFRNVFGDEAMPAPGKRDPRVRVLYMYQYDNNNRTATDAFNFIDGYYNKVHPASTYAGDPKPVSYFIYGGGAATYYASADRLGLMATHPLTAEGHGTFEEPILPAGEAREAPTESPWTFTGTAGIYRETGRFPGSYGEIPTPTKNVDDFNYRGMKITVGATDVAIYEVGRYVHDGNNGTSTVAIYETTGSHESLFSREIRLGDWPAGTTAWQRTGRNIFIISNKAYSKPVILEAGQSYYIVCQESSTGNSHAGETPFVPPPGVTVDGAVLGRNQSGTWTWQVGSTPNRTYGPVNFKLAPSPSVTDKGLPLGFLPDSKDGVEDTRSIDKRYFSPQAAFIAGEGSMEIEITFPRPGIYGLVYGLGYRPDQTPYSDVETVGMNRPIIELIEDWVASFITPRDQQNVIPNTGTWSHEGYWVKPKSGYDFYGSAPFEITDPSKTYRIRFRGSSTDPTDLVLIDNVRLAAADKMTEGQIPSGGGFAEGAPDVSNWEARVMSMYKYAQSYGLQAASYEGGWYPGGDANKMPLQYSSSFFAEAMVQGEKNAINALNRAGLAMNTDYTRGFAIPDNGIDSPETYRRMQAWQQLADTLQEEATNGQSITSIFTAESSWLSHQTSGSTMEDGGWFSWNVIAPETGYFDVQLETSGSGQVQVWANEAILALEGAAGDSLQTTSPIFLTKGLHTIRIINREAVSELGAISITKANQLPGFNGLTASPGNAEVYLDWPDIAGASGYHVYIKSRLESDFTRITTDPVTISEYVAGGLLNDTTYNVVVTYLDDSLSESAFSNQISVVPSEVARLLAWEFDDSNTKTSGALPPQEQSPKLAAGITLVTGAWKGVDSNGHMTKDAVGFGGGWNLDAIELRDDHYVGFAVTPEVDTILRLTELRFGMWWTRDQNKDFHTISAELRVSTDGFASYATVPLNPDPTSVPASNGNTSSGRKLSADLSSLTNLRNLPAGTFAEFRIHFYGEGVTYWGIGKLGDDTADLELYGFPVDPEAIETPVASPASGTYASPLTVTIETETTGANIRYTLDGSPPTETHGTLIASARGNITLVDSATVRAIAFASGKPSSAVLTRSYTIAPVTSVPRFSLPAGSYGGEQSLTLTSITSRANIRYTLDGSDPTPELGEIYRGPIPLTENATVKAIAYLDGFVPSEVVAASYTINPAAPGLIQLYRGTESTPESGSGITINVSRSDGSFGHASVAYTTADGTATAGTDFTATTGTLEWTDGDMTDRQITIPIAQDELAEGDESFHLHLQNVLGASLGTPTSVEITIVEDDTPLIVIYPVIGARIREWFTLDASITGIGSISSSWSVISGPGTLTFDDSSAISTTAYTETEGVYLLELSATDELRSNAVQVAVNVAFYNHPPEVLNPLTDGLGLAGKPLTYLVPEDTFADREDTDLSLTISRDNGGPLPAWLSFDHESGTLAGTPRTIHAGMLDLVVTATDSGGESASTPLQIKIHPGLLLSPVLLPDLDHLPSGDYDGGIGEALGPDQLDGNVTGRSGATIQVISSGGVANSAHLELNQEGLRSRTMTAFHGATYRFRTHFLYDPSNLSNTGMFVAMGLCLPDGAETSSPMWDDYSERILVGLGRSKSGSHEVEIAQSGRLMNYATLPTAGLDVGNATLLPDQWYLLSFEMTYHHNAERPGDSTVHIRNLFVEERGADGSTPGERVISMSSYEDTPPSGGQDFLQASTTEAYLYVTANGNIGTNTLDHIEVHQVQLEEGSSAFVRWRDSIGWRQGDDASPRGVVAPAGFPNLLAFAMSIDPYQTALAEMLPTLHATQEEGEEGGHTVRLATRKRKDLGGLSWQILGSTDMRIWNAIATTLTVLDPDCDGDGETELVEYAAPIPELAEELFLRIKVSETE